MLSRIDLGYPAEIAACVSRTTISVVNSISNKLLSTSQKLSLKLIIVH